MSTSTKTLLNFCEKGIQTMDVSLLFGQQKAKGLKEYVAASKHEQHSILATQEEQFITLRILEDFLR